MKTKNLVLAGLTTIAISACSSDSPSSPDSLNTDVSQTQSADAANRPETVLMHGDVYTLTFEKQELIRFNGWFWQYSEPVSTDILIAQNTERDKLLHGCHFSGDGVDTPNDIPDEITRDLVSAGDNIVLSTPNGTFADIERFDDGMDFYGGPIYSNMSDLPPLPPNLTMSIPGDVFPAFNVEFPHVEKIVADGYTVDMPTRLDATFSWIAADDSDATMILSFNDDPRTSSVICYVPDTGSFQFPQNVIDHFGIDQPMTLSDIERRKTSVYFNDNAMLTVRSSTSLLTDG